MKQDQKIEQFIEKWFPNFDYKWELYLYKHNQPSNVIQDLKSLMDSKWIGVKDGGNPKIPDNYIAKRKCMKKSKCYNFDGKQWTDISIVGKYCPTDITHWQPLPQPPKELK